jgi:hypothetical protein
MHRLLLSLLIAAGLACSALAQAPAPVGSWVPEDAPESAGVMVMPNCDYLARDQRSLLEGRWAGRPACATSGVLTITYQAPPVTQALRIDWLNRAGRWSPTRQQRAARLDHTLGSAVPRGSCPRSSASPKK